jgi:hypothetical protein
MEILTVFQLWDLKFYTRLMNAQQIQSHGVLDLDKARGPSDRLDTPRVRMKIGSQGASRGFEPINQRAS